MELGLQKIDEERSSTKENELLASARLSQESFPSKEQLRNHHAPSLEES